GLNFALSGLPYWTTDIGGFTSGNPNDPAYRELFIRWFQFGTFCPIFRVHGTRVGDQNELWSYGPDAQKILTSFDRLRYRLMPYIYSLAWKVASEDYTMQRPLVMDWRTDVQTWNRGDEFMFGPALLVSPVLQAATQRSVYLPAARWTDFWSGKTVEGGREMEADAPLERMPLFVRAGSIVPMGPEIEYAGQDPAGPIELRIYRGADGTFDLYEDAGDGYQYQRGEHTVIPIHWDDRNSVLTVGAREGSFPGMVEKRAIRVVLVGDGHGTGEAVTAAADAEVTYEGRQVQVTVR
ncbi:MAG: glycoside hydrolase family 31 protein, partial [Acidobacteriota bacterium]|nr:glycoside hydrolase family 31 protein [Acidobacteriota bacterium]